MSSRYSVQITPFRYDSRRSSWLLTPRIYPGDVGSVWVQLKSEDDIVAVVTIKLYRDDACLENWVEILEEKKTIFLPKCELTTVFDPYELQRTFINQSLFRWEVYIDEVSSSSSLESSSVSSLLSSSSSLFSSTSSSSQSSSSSNSSSSSSNSSSSSSSSNSSSSSSLSSSSSGPLPFVSSSCQSHISSSSSYYKYCHALGPYYCFVITQETDIYYLEKLNATVNGLDMGSIVPLVKGNPLLIAATLKDQWGYPIQNLAHVSEAMFNLKGLYSCETVFEITEANITFDSEDLGGVGTAVFTLPGTASRDFVTGEYLGSLELKWDSDTKLEWKNLIRINVVEDQVGMTFG